MNAAGRPKLPPPGTYDVKLVKVEVTPEPRQLAILCTIVGGEFDGHVLKMKYYDYEEVNDEHDQVA